MEMLKKVSDEQKDYISSLLFSESEIQLIAQETDLLFKLYVKLYKSNVPLTKKWAKRKGMSRYSFWKGLGAKNNQGMFFDLFNIKFLPKKFNGMTVYQVDYFDIEIADTIGFKSACDRLGYRRLLPENMQSFDESTGGASSYFCGFIKNLNIQSVLSKGLEKII